MITSFRHLDSFEDLIRDSFKDFIEAGKLNFESNSTEFSDDFRLKGQKSELQFTYDRGDLRCSIINLNTGKKYLVNLVYKLLYPTEKGFTISVNDSPEQQILTYAEIIRKKLFNVLNGDFSWVERYR